MSLTRVNMTVTSVNEAYILLSAYLREEKIAADYNKEYLKEFVEVLHDILKNPNNFKSTVESDEAVTQS